MFFRGRQRGDDWTEHFASHAAKAPAGPLKSFYQSTLPGPKTPLEDVPMISIDLETTGLDPDRDSIISIGMVDMDIQRIYCRSACHWTFNPKRPLTRSSVPIHEITDTDVQGSPSLESRFSDILDALAGKIVVVHYLPIERRFLAKAAQRIYGYPLHFPIVDTMDLEKRHLRKGLRVIFPRADSVRLDACRTRLHLPRYKAHHALTDALATAELLQAQVAHRYNASDPVSQFWV